MKRDNRVNMIVGGELSEVQHSSPKAGSGAVGKL